MQFINGIVISLLVEGAKRAQNVPLSADNKKMIRVVGLGLSILSTLIVAFANGSLVEVVGSADFSNMVIGAVMLLSNSVGTWFMSVLSYHGLLKK